MDVTFKKLIKPEVEILEHLNRWENDPVLIPLIRPNPNKHSLERKEILTMQDLNERLVHNRTFLIYLDDQLIGEMDYQIDRFPHSLPFDTAFWQLC